MTGLFATLLFAIFATVPSLLLSVVLLYGSTPRRPSAGDDLLVAAYIVGMATLLSSAGFFLTTVLDRRWRRLPVKPAAIIAAVLGLTAPMVTLLVAAASTFVVLPLLRSASPLGAVLFYGLPGVVLGLIAVVAGRVVSRMKDSRMAP